MLVDLNVIYYPDDYDADEYKSLGKKPKLSQGKLVVNTDHVVAYNEHEQSGGTMIRLTNGENFQSSCSFKYFNDLMMGMQLAQNMLVSGGN